MDNDVTIVVDAKNRTATAFGAAAKGAKTVGDVAERTGKQVKDMGDKLEAANTKARQLALAEERAAERARRLAQDLALAKQQLEGTDDKTGALGRRVERLAIDLRFAAAATDEYRRSANRASEEAREQARAYDRVADNARQAARAVALLGASTKLGERASGGGFFGRIGGFFGGIFGDAGKAGAGVGTSAAEGGLSTPVLGPALLMAGGAAAGLAAFPVGGAIGGATLAGLGAGVAGAGLAGAWMGDPVKYQAKWDSLVDHVTKRWRDSSKQYGDELDLVLKTAAQTVDRLPLERMLGVSQSFVAPLATGAGAGVGNFGAGLADALDKAQPVVNTLGPKLAELGHAGGDALRAISMGSEGGAHALGDLVDGLSATVRGIGIMILGLEDGYERMRDFAKGTYDAATSIPIIGSRIEGFADRIWHTDASVIKVGRSLDSSSRSSDHFGSSLVSAAKDAASATIATLGFNDALTQTRNTLLGLADANLGVAQGWLDLKKELNDGARTLDLNKQAGIDNAKAIEQQVKLLEQQRQQAISTGGNTEDAINKANAAYDAGIQRLERMAHEAGFTDSQVDELLRSYGAFPPVVQTQIKTPGLIESATTAAKLAASLAAAEGTHTANVYVYYHTKGQSLNAPQAAGGPTGSGMSEVNDWGGAGTGEIIKTPSGSMVIPAGTGRQLLHNLATAGGGGGGTQVVEIRFTGSGALYQTFLAAQRAGEMQILSSAIVN